MSANEPGATWIPSPFFFSGRDGQTPRWLIIHGTAGGSSAQNIAAWFQNQQAQVSSHYIVDQAGGIIQCVAESDAAWTNGVLSIGHDSWWSDAINPNYQTISIEHVKPSTDNSDQITLSQQMASFQLIADICQRWNIPMREADETGGITGHYSLDPVSRSNCPGPYPWDGLWAYLKGVPVQIIPQGWSYNAQTQVLTAPNKLAVHLGMAQFVLNQAGGWNPANVPLELEHGTGTPGNTVQLFRDCQLQWSQSTNQVTYAPLGQAYQTALAQANTTLSQLASKVNVTLAQMQQHVTLLQQDVQAAEADLTPLTS